MKIGIVGLPNVGKSTLFNAFLKKQIALSANYPFATIEPNVGVVDVVDKNVDKLAKISSSENKVYSNITFVDIAGIVKDASKGEGLGNKFLANIREVDLILILLRDFEDQDIIKEHSKNPEDDYLTITTELILKDLETIEAQKAKYKKGAKTKDEEHFLKAILKIEKSLNNIEPAIKADLNDDEFEQVRVLNLLTLKPFVKVYNVEEERLASPDDKLVVSAKFESELAQLDSNEKKEFLESVGLKTSPLDIVIKKCFSMLGYETFYTTGEKESRAWKFKKGSTAPVAASVIHTDFEKNFIKAEVIKLEYFLMHKSKQKVKDAGKLRLEGKDYIVQDEDIIEFKIGASK